MEQSHHLTASLYFATAALEAFLNERFREANSEAMSETELFDHLRKTRLMDKIKKWPELLTGRKLELRKNTIEFISNFADMRGHLAHPKGPRFDQYDRLDSLDAQNVISVVAEYVAQYHKAAATHFPYWLWGWNYLNPSRSSHDIIQINEQQFILSLLALGITVDGVSNIDVRIWRASFMSDFEGFQKVEQALAVVKGCEPKNARFPFQPKLCRRWWVPEHQQTCGYVTEASLKSALDADQQTRNAVP